MSAASSYGPIAGRRHDGVLFGVCAAIANNTGLPAMLTRVAFAIAGLCHLFLAAVLYAGLAYWFARRNGAADGRPQDRFGSLECRLRGLEAATMAGEAELRRQFRDLR